MCTNCVNYGSLGKEEYKLAENILPVQIMKICKCNGCNQFNIICGICKRSCAFGHMSEDLIFPAFDHMIKKHLEYPPNWGFIQGITFTSKDGDRFCVHIKDVYDWIPQICCLLPHIPYIISNKMNYAEGLDPEYEAIELADFLREQTYSCVICRENGVEFDFDCLPSIEMYEMHLKKHHADL